LNGGSNDMVVAPDGAHAYVTGRDAVIAFSRDAGTGLLTFVEAEHDGVAGVDGLGGASRVAISADGASVYVIGATDDAVASFSRDTLTGALTFLEAHFDGVGGVDGLDNPSALALSPDGTSLYVASSDERALAVFARDPGTGLLTFLSAEHGGLDVDASGTGGSHVVAVSPDGTSVYVGGNGTVTAFDRDLGTGAVTLVQVDSEIAPRAFVAAGAIAVSPDGTLVYVAGADPSFPHDILIFGRDSGTGRLSLPILETQGRDPNTSFGRDIAITADGANLYTSGGASYASGFSGCDPTPAAGCSSGKGKISLKAGSKAFSSTWIELGDTLDLAGFGDPSTATTYALCVYQSNPTPELVLRAMAPAGGICRISRPPALPCWTAQTRLFSYKDPYEAPEGIKILRVPSLAARHPVKLLVKGKGDHVGFPSLPLTGVPVLVQLQASNGSCWESSYTTAVSNTPSSFRARTP
jgi:DNA-binding beta-propeller fold protein YncE